ncbi:MAG: YggT family protein [Candidatus Binatia bacterium]
MFLISNLLTAFAAILGTLLTVYTWILIARAVISWVSPDPYNPIVRFLYNVTEPVLYRVRRLVPSVFGGIDLSPLILIFALQFLQIFLVRSLHDLAATLR